MVRRIGSGLFVCALFLGAVGVVGALDVVAPSSVVLGDAFSVVVPAKAGVRGISAEVFDSRGTALLYSRGFRVASDGGEWVATVGVPTTLLPGSYTLLTRVKTAAGSTRQEATIELEGRRFHHEHIDLDQALTHLQTEQTALKKHQAQILWAMLTSFHAQGVYQKGPLIVPVSGYFVSAPFAERRVFVFAHGGTQHSIHQGIDLAVPAGTPVRAAGAGKVMFAGSWIMTGNSVVIEQLPEVYSLYFHMEKLLVHAGQVVHQGQKIGLVGSTGLATGPHLHWQVEVDGVAVDPMRLLRKGLVPGPPAVAEALRK